MMTSPLTGLIAATYTPFFPDGALRLEEIPKLVEHLISDGVSGLYVCGSTGEGMSLTTNERKAVTESFVQASSGRVPVIVQVGHNSVTDACDLAAHAQQVGADVISATAPSYFKIGTPELLTECMAQIASAAHELPFYYYHIPALTGVSMSVTGFLDAAQSAIPNLVGVKYTEPTLHEYQACIAAHEGAFDMLWGVDEMLLPALSVGARGAVGSTYNLAAPLYTRLIAALEAGDLVEARRLQLHSVQLVRLLCNYPFHSAMKVALTSLGIECGPCRSPQEQLSDTDKHELTQQLEASGFYEWARMSDAATS